MCVLLTLVCLVARVCVSEMEAAIRARFVLACMRDMAHGYQLTGPSDGKEAGKMDSDTGR